MDSELSRRDTKFINYTWILLWKCVFQITACRNNYKKLNKNMYTRLFFKRKTLNISASDLLNTYIFLFWSFVILIFFKLKYCRCNTYVIFTYTTYISKIYWTTYELWVRRITDKICHPWFLFSAPLRYLHIQTPSKTISYDDGRERREGLVHRINPRPCWKGATYNDNNNNNIKTTRGKTKYNRERLIITFFRF